jgi:hypothetical protein
MCLRCLVGRAGLLYVHAHEHKGCGHSMVADEARRWSQLHRQHRQLLEQQAAAGMHQPEAVQLATAAYDSAGSPHNSSSGHHGGPVPRLLQATSTVPIRVWVEYQGITGLSEDGKQRLYDTVNIALGVLQKFFKVCAHTWVSYSYTLLAQLLACSGRPPADSTM